MSLTTPSIYIIFTSLLSFVLAAYTFRNRHKNGLLWLSLLFMAVGLWSLSYGIQLTTADLAMVKLISQVTYLSIICTPVFWLLFTVDYSGGHVKPAWVIALFLVPAFSLVSHATNDLHYLFHRSYESVLHNGQVYYNNVFGPLFWVHAFYSYIIICTGIGYLVKMLFMVSKKVRRNITIILIGAAFPFTVNIANLIGFDIFGYLDPTPTAFLVMSIFVATGVFFNDIFKITPFAFDTLFNSIGDAALVFDNDLNIINTNQQADNLIGNASNGLAVLAAIQSNIERWQSSGWLKDKVIEQHQIGGSYFEITFTPVQGEKISTIGVLALVRNITEQKQTMQKLIESREEYLTLFEQATEAIFVIDSTSGKFHIANQRAEELTGYSSENLKELSIGEVIVFNKKITSDYFLVDSKTDFGEVEIIRRDGFSRNVLLSAVSLNNNTIVAFAKDITQWKNAQEELIAERNLFSSGPVFTIEWVPEKGFPVKRVSQNITQITGYTPEDMLKPDFKYLDIIHPTHREAVEKEAIEKIEQKVDAFDQSYLIKTKNGEYHWFYVFAKVEWNINGDVQSVRGYLFDQTKSKLAEEELKSSREQFHLLLDNVFDGIYMIKGERFEFVNKPFCDIFEYTFNEITSESFNLWDTLTDQSRELVKERYDARLRGEELSSVYEMQIISKSGEIKECEITATEISKDKTPLIMGIIRDITHIKKARLLEQEVSLARKEANFKQNFLATMSHEIRTPLTGVLGMAEILSRSILTTSQRDYLNTLIESGENLRNIINLILDYSKLEAGQMSVNPKPFDFNRFIDNIKNLFQVLCDQSVRLHIAVDPEIPQFILADRGKVSQVLSNLISNAIKYTLKGKIILRAFLLPAHKDHAHDDLTILIEVEDTGIGIHKENLPKLFKPFFQVEEKQPLTQKGTGLGLSICKQLTELLGGTISVESEPDKGSTFRFTFKAKVSASDFELASETKNQKISGEGKHGLNIMVAEDLAINRKVIEILLGFLGHTVTFAHDGEKAIKLFKPDLYDLILMDIQMPVMDGISATKYLRENYEKLPPIVGLSANALEGDRERYLAEGLDDYITKPMKEKDFAELIQRLF
jgi:PAS domain S-box-containing protein